MAGQHADYLDVALGSYKVNEKPLIGRSHLVMAGIARQFSDKEMKVLAAHVASLPSEMQTVQRSRLKQAGLIRPASVPGGVALHTGHIGIAVGRLAVALAVPDHLAQALHGGMVCVMQ